MVSRWSESIYSDVLSPRTDGLSFLSQLDACLYEGTPMDDELLTAEANLWSNRFIHLRLIGKRIQPQPINVKCEEASFHLPTVSFITPIQIIPLG
ncbi:unnamed protein product [Auanema sp. JU1783]|nr:unnamed protein product [Auanema sp. JU1783]